LFNLYAAGVQHSVPSRCLPRRNSQALSANSMRGSRPSFLSSSRISPPLHGTPSTAPCWSIARYSQCASASCSELDHHLVEVPLVTSGQPGRSDAGRYPGRTPPTIVARSRTSVQRQGRQQSSTCAGSRGNVGTATMHSWLRQAGINGRRGG